MAVRLSILTRFLLLMLVAGGCETATPEVAPVTPTPAPSPTAAARHTAIATAPSPSPFQTQDDVPMTVVVTDDGCTYEGPATVSAGEVVISATNESQDRANVVVHRLSEGYSLTDHRERINEVQARIDAGQPLPGPASWAPPLSWAHNIDPGGSDEISAAVTAGTFYSISGGTFDGADWGSSAKSICSAGGFEVTD
jgi:hypothetical protein